MMVANIIIMSSSSLRRDGSEADSSHHFSGLSSVLPSLIDMEPSLKTQAQLQTLCNLMREHPSYTLAHVVVVMDLRNASIKEKFFK